MKPQKIISFILALIVALVPLSASAASEKKLNYLVLGDSIGFGAGIVNPDEACYGKIVADTNGYNYKNLSVSGYNTDALLAHMLLPTVKEAIEEADIISLSIGGNDFLTSNMVQLCSEAAFLNDYSTFDEISSKFYDNYCKIIADIKKLNPDAVILAQTLYNPMYNAARNIYQAGADRLNAGYRRYLSENPGSIVIVDVGSAFEGHEEYIANDCIHPNAAGNVEIARLVLKALKSLKLGEKTTPVITAAGADNNLTFGYKILLEATVNYLMFIAETVSPLISLLK